MKLKPIRDQVVVIVGATSGIGRETALQFAQKGAQVVVSGRSPQALEVLSAEIRRRGGEVLAVQADVTDPNQMAHLANRAVETFGRIDTWVHAAAVSMYAGFEDTKPEEFRRIIEVNLLGQAYGAMAALPHLKREGRGALIHISSVEARRSLPLQSAYAASKHGMVGFLDSLRMELQQAGLPIAVVNVMPASINTPLFEKALTRLGVKPRPIQPVYAPDEVARSIVYAAEHPARDIFVGGAGKALSMMQRMSPEASDAFLAKLGFEGQKTEYPKSESAPNNLYEHLSGFDTVKGSFTHQEKKASLFTRLRTNPVAGLAVLAAGLAAGVLFTMRSMSE